MNFKYYKEPIVELPKKSVLVFGSNLAGRHGKGAALIAKQRYGAVYGLAEGHRGDSYAIPIKDERLRLLPLVEIERAVMNFIDFAYQEEDSLDFFVTRIGCGLAGYQDKDIAWMFYQVPENCIFDEKWKEYLET